MDDKKKIQSMDDLVAGHWTGDLGTDEEDSMKLTPAQRIEMIEKVFVEVLARKPDTRDLNYYKYSSLSEDEIRTELLNGKEHRILIENGREFQKVKNLLENAKSRVRVLERQILDQEESFKQLNTLLKEKNTHIEELRKQLKNPFQC